MTSVFRLALWRGVSIISDLGEPIMGLNFGAQKNIDYQKFREFYESIRTTQGRRPFATFSPEATAYFSEQIAPLRTRSWASTQKWGSLAEATGLIGELGTFALMGFDAEWAYQNFINGLNGSDSGIDFEWAGEKIDIKGTRGQALKFKLSKTNKNASRASIFLFAHVQDTQQGGVTAQALGWSWRHQIGPWIRDDERYRFVRFETLDREGLAYTLDALKAMAEGKEA
jgi:hypothetical protein